MLRLLRSKPQLSSSSSLLPLSSSSFSFSTTTNIRDRIKQQRQSRLNRGTNARTLTTNTLDDIHKIRNIGIIAHIDAGKTTTTQRMLYYAGALPSPGNIDQGTTAMDYLVQERERGITIRSAAISFNWKDNQVNLIDTPGHVDFSAEVTRSLQVLDGAVTILDAVKGVQSQTQKVWAYANKHNLPKICYLNKMDRIGSSVQQTLISIKSKLNIKPLLLQSPIGDGDSFKGIIDLIDLQQIQFHGKYGQDLSINKILKNTQKHNYAIKLRNQLVQAVSDYDDLIADLFLADQYVPSTTLKEAIRKILISKEYRTKVAPVLMGSSYRNKGIQPLLNAVADYLPSPVHRDPVTSQGQEVESRAPNKNDPFTGYVFKVLFDSQRGPLAYTRVYSGQLKKVQQIYNSTKRIPQKISHILRVRSNQYVPIQSIGTGDIVALSGLKQTRAGDTLTLGSDSFKLPQLDIPTPVFTAPFQLPSDKNLRQFNQSMSRATIQDNSLTYKYQSQTNQYLVSGLGQLHLQILRDRLNAENIGVKMGNLKINFKETVNRTENQVYHIKKEVKPMQYEEFYLKLGVMPLRDENDKVEGKNQVVVMFERVAGFDAAWMEFVRRKNSKLLGEREDLSKLKKVIRNPTYVQPIYEQQQQDSPSNNNNNNNNKESQQEQQKSKYDQQPYYHINCLPFETLYQLTQSCKTSTLYGRNNLPAMGIQIQILDGKYKKSSFSKSTMNRCASTLARKLIDKCSTLIEPIMQFNLIGDQKTIQLALKDVLRKRGSITEQEQTMLEGVIPAEGVRGWVKELRSMGLEIELKFAGYAEVVGVSPEKLLEDNNM